MSEGEREEQLKRDAWFIEKIKLLEARIASLENRMAQVLPDLT